LPAVKTEITGRSSSENKINLANLLAIPIPKSGGCPLSADQLAMGVGIGVGVPLSISHLQAQVHRRRLRDGPPKRPKCRAHLKDGFCQNTAKIQKPRGKANK